MTRVSGGRLVSRHYWAFDHGMMGVAASYEIIIPGRIATAPNDPDFLTALAGRPIIPPADPDLRPAS